MRAQNPPYCDPLEAVWLAAADALGLAVQRTLDVYASYNGEGSLFVGTDEVLDEDDCLAQMVFHELCHWLVEGRDAASLPDWGLDNQTDRHRPRERAALRLQALVADPWGLRRVLAPTTDFRAFYDALPLDPLHGPDNEVSAARRGAARAEQPPFSEVLSRALRATRTIFHAAEQAQRSHGGTSLSSLLEPLRPTHPSGFFVRRPELGPATCGGCAWSHRGGRGRPVLRCRHSNRRVAADSAACERWEPPLSCGPCGACCREGFDVAPLSAREPVAKRHPHLVERGPFGLQLPRPHGSCVALRREGTSSMPYRCAIYDDRPRACRELEVGSQACLQARQRVGLSR